MMLKDKNIIFFSLPRHDESYTSTPWQLATELSKDNRVIFIDHPYTFLELIRGFHKKEIVKRVKGYFASSSFLTDGLEVLLPPFVWPVNFLPKGKLYNFICKINEGLVAKRINRLLKANSIPSVIYVNSFEFYYPTIQHLLKGRVELSVYHCIDPMVKSFTVKHGPYMQQRAAKNADVIISTAPALQEDFSHLGYTKNYLVPNAANFSLFNTACDNALSIHISIRDIKGKVFGFLGNIERRTDFDLLLYAINRLEKWTLVMAGPVQNEFVPDALWNHARVRFIGPVSHHDAPGVVKRFDVAVIPFQCDDVSRGIYPLKLFEYLAAGKPLVSTNFNPEVLNQLIDVVEVSINQEDFVAKIEESLMNNGHEKICERVSIASHNTWKERASLFSDFINLNLA